MSLLSNWTEVTLAAELYVILSCSLLLFTKGVHWEAKKNIKIALILKSDLSLPSLIVVVLLVFFYH